MTTSTDGSEDCKYVRRIGGKKQVDMGREREWEVLLWFCMVFWIPFLVSLRHTLSPLIKLD